MSQTTAKICLLISIVFVKLEALINKKEFLICAKKSLHLPILGLVCYSELKKLETLYLNADLLEADQNLFTSKRTDLKLSS
jgi:hypothetical protein